MPSSLSRKPAHRAPDAPTTPSPKGGYSARRQKGSSPARPSLWGAEQAGSPLGNLTPPGAPLGHDQPHGGRAAPTVPPCRLGGTQHNSQGIFSLHQNNLTADGGRHPQYGSSSPCYGAESMGLQDRPVMPWASNFQKASLSNGRVAKIGPRL